MTAQSEIPSHFTAQQLHELASNRADLWGQILHHPNVYPELREWILQQHPQAADPQAHASEAHTPADSQHQTEPPQHRANGRALKICLVVLMVLGVGTGVAFLMHQEGERQRLAAAEEEEAAEKLAADCDLAESLVAPLEDAYDRLGDDHIAIGLAAAEAAETAQDIQRDKNFNEDLKSYINDLTWEAPSLGQNAEELSGYSQIGLYDSVTLAEKVGRMSVSIELARSGLDLYCIAE